DLGGVDGRLPLRVVEVRRDSDDGLTNGVPEIGFRGLLEFAKNQRGNLWRRELLAVDVHFDQVVWPAGDLVWDELLFRLDFIVPASHEALDRIDGAPRIGDRLPLG